MPPCRFPALVAALEAFGRSVEGKQPFPITHAEIRHGVAVFEAIITSAAARQTVKVA